METRRPVFSICAALALPALALMVVAVPFAEAVATDVPLEKSCSYFVNYAGGETLANFPLMLKLSEGDGTGFAYADAAADGSDIRFYSSDGVLLNHEIARWDSSGESVVYVGLPALQAGTTFVMRWKKATAAELPAVDAKAVWTNAGYRAVWHFENYDDGFKNSAADDLVAVAQPDTDPPSVVPGIVGGAADIAKTHPLHAMTEGVYLTKPFTVSAWTYYGMPSADVERGSGRIWTTGTGNGAANFFFNFQQEYIFGDGNLATLGTGHCKSYVWQHLTAIYNGASSKVYLDEQTLKSGINVTTSDTKQYTVFGLGAWTSTTSNDVNNFTGTLDEIRIRQGSTSAAWLAAEDANVQPGFVVPMAQPSSLSRGCTIAATNLATGVVLTNFPLMVKLTANNKYGFAYADAAADGSDVRFFDADDMQLFHEVASWNQAGESVLYVSVPRLSGDTVVTMRWHKKNPSAVLPPMPASAVWTAAGYKFVWHLDRYDSTIGGYANSVSTNYPAKPVGTAPTVVAGAQGPAVGIYGDYPLLAQGPGYVFSQPFTVSCWSRYPSDRWDCASGSGRIWTCGTNNQAANIFFNWKQGFVMGDTDSGDLAKYLPFQKAAAGDTDEQTKAKSHCKKDTWQFVTGVYQSTSSKTYLDGVLIPQDSSDYHQLDTLSTSRMVFGLGGFTDAQPGATANFQGEIDEIRIRSGVASADWVKAEYDNVTDAGFLKISRLPVSGFAVHLL